MQQIAMRAMKLDRREIEPRGAAGAVGKGIAQAPEIVVCDASFIGLEIVLPAPLALAAPNAELVALIKPQFEVGKGRVGRGGVVRDPALHDEVCKRIVSWLGAQLGWQVLGITESPLRGPDGNIEFLIGARHRA